jgi:hypothetical protein
MTFIHPKMGQHLANKFRRAIRNGQGSRFTADELQTLAEMGTLDLIQRAESEELLSKCQERTARSSMANTGSTSAVTARPRRLADRLVRARHSTGPLSQH